MIVKNNKKEKIIIFASGTKDNGGGSGFENIVIKSRLGEVDYEVAGVISNWPMGGVYKKALQLDIPFSYFSKPYTLEGYRNFIEKYKTDWIILAGWLKLVPIANPILKKDGLNPTKTLNIHPGPLPKFGGSGMYGSAVHEKVLEAYKNGEIKETGPTIHFVTDQYDQGPQIFHKTTKISPEETVQSLSLKVTQIEHEWYPQIINLVVNGKIYWNGIDHNSLVGLLI